MSRVEVAAVSQKRRHLFERTKGQNEMTKKTNAVLMGRMAGIASVLALTAAPALAGGIAEPAPAPAVVPTAPVAAPGMDWTGPYGGIQLEYGDTGLGVDADIVDSIFEDEDTSGDGFLGGVFAGYRYDFGDYVVGVELDHLASDIDLEVDTTDGTADGSFDRLTRLGVEAGFDAGRALFYGTVGAANASVEVGGDDSTSNGYFYGIGMDYAVTEQITVGAELLQHEFDDFDFDGASADVDATTFGVNAAFRF
jgi:opacity protein-like surface antigen